MKTLSKLILSISVLALVACGGGDQKSTNSNELSGAIKIDGSSTVYPITEAVAEECLNKMSF
jgi:phosphate transport system substrate-binding protein